jgi:hypothetical protein
MKKLLTLFALTAAVALGSVASRVPAAPALGDKPVRYEFAELSYSQGNRGNPAFVPGQPGIPQVIPFIIARFSTSDEELEGTSWEDLANKLKAPAPKKESLATVHKLRVLNKLNADGWEVIEHTALAVTPMIWSLRRKVP